MSFKFYRKGVEITAPRRIKWHFDIMPNTIFESAPDKLETNANYWRKKLNFPPDAQDVQIVFVPSEDYDIEYVNYLNTGTYESLNDTFDTDPDNSVSDDGTTEESSVSQDTEDIIDTPKRKRKQEAAELPAVPEQLDDADSSASE